MTTVSEQRITDEPALRSSLRCGVWRAVAADAPPPACAGKTQNVVLIVSDGLRWQEVFTGADQPCSTTRTAAAGSPKRSCASATGAPDAEARRALLFPFLWGTVAKQGQIFGNQIKGSVAHVTNGKAFSYPGYNEMSTGYPNDAIDSNEFGPNPNADRVRVAEQARRYPRQGGDLRHLECLRQHLQQEPQRPRHADRLDACRAQGASRRRATRCCASCTHDHHAVRRGGRGQLASCRCRCWTMSQTRHPRVLFVGYGETDNWAHQGRYDLVLDSAHRMDRFVEQLWEAMQSMPRIPRHHHLHHHHRPWPRQRTDRVEGARRRGEGLGEHLDRRDRVPIRRRSASARMWRRSTQAQIAATVAAFLGKDYRHDVPKAAPRSRRMRRARALE